MSRILSSVLKAAAFVIAFQLPTAALAQDSHPQEVLDLVATHQALAMKIRPLQDRIIVRRVPPKDSQSSDTRVSERLRHKNRAATSTDEFGRIKVQFLKLEKEARTERERVMRPDFGSGLREVAAAKKKLASLQRRYAALERELTALEKATLRKRPGRTTY